MAIESQASDLTVVIPCYNEARNIERGVLNEVHDYLVLQTYAWEVIIVNDESTDRSKQLIEEIIRPWPRFSLVDILHGGKPAAVWAGIQHARGAVVLFTDMDQSTPIKELGKLLPWYDAGFQVVIGSRGAAREGFSIVRKLGSFVFRTFRGLFLLRGINDTQCGFKTCLREAALATFPKLQFFKEESPPTGWKVSAYDVELLYLFQKAGYPIKEIEVTWLNRDVSDTKGQRSELARYLHESVDMAREVYRVKRNEMRGLYQQKSDSDALAES